MAAGFTFADEEAWELRQFRQRAVVAGLVVLVAFLVLFGRFVYLQVFRHDYYLTRAQENRISIVPVVPQRGMILDRNGTVLARNDSAFTLEITPGRTAGLEQTIDLVAQLIDIDARDRRRFRKLLDESKNFESLPLKVRLSDEEVARVSAQLYRLPGVEVKARQFRLYPLGGLASHALGHMGRISERDRDFLVPSDSVPNYRGTDHIGKLGLENAYELDLHGTTGYQEVETDAAGRAAVPRSSTGARCFGDVQAASSTTALTRAMRRVFIRRRILRGRRARTRNVAVRNARRRGRPPPRPGRDRRGPARRADRRRRAGPARRSAGPCRPRAR